MEWLGVVQTGLLGGVVGRRERVLEGTRVGVVSEGRLDSGESLSSQGDRRRGVVEVRQTRTKRGVKKSG